LVATQIHCLNVPGRDKGYGTKKYTLCSLLSLKILSSVTVKLVRFVNAVCSDITFVEFPVPRPMNKKLKYHKCKASSSEVIIGVGGFFFSKNLNMMQFDVFNLFRMSGL